MGAKAKDSKQVQRARRKLLNQLADEKAKINEMSLLQMRQANRQWLDRHREDRINIKDRTIKLFDENKHPARTKSKFIFDLMRALNPSQDEKMLFEHLAGRISHEPRES